ncbi:MAG: hemin uptake protein HemP [Aquabacterium sp.]
MAETVPPAAASIDSRTLFRGHKVLHIQHDGALYQLRTTKTGKLILTK